MFAHGRTIALVAALGAAVSGFVARADEVDDLFRAAAEHYAQRQWQAACGPGAARAPIQRETYRKTRDKGRRLRSAAGHARRIRFIMGLRARVRARICGDLSVSPFRMSAMSL